MWPPVPPPAINTRTKGLLTLLARAALRAKIRPDEAESEGCGGTTVEDENEVWPDFCRNPEGEGGFSRSLRLSSLKYTRYLSLLVSRTQKNPPLSLSS
jgi:hypothetical protein